MPGDKEIREQAAREANGCVVDDTTWAALVAVAKRLGLPETAYRAPESVLAN
jgi:LDH2 family malate/lactate/ureidoglycolate dehydrogenase